MDPPAKNVPPIDDSFDEDWPLALDDELAREVPLEVMQRLGGALTMDEMTEASRGEDELLPRLRLRAYLETARISLEDGKTEKALHELEEIQRLLKQVGGVGEAHEASELKKDVERSLVARSVSPENIFHVFAEVNEVIHSPAPFDKKVESLLGRVGDAVDADRALWAASERGGDSLEMVGTSNIAPENAAKLLKALYAGGLDHVTHGQPVISVDVESDERFTFDPSLGEIDSLIVVPFGTGTESSGVIYFDRLVAPEQVSFTQTDLDLVTALAGSIAVLVVEDELGRQLEANVALRRQLSEKYSWQNVVTRNKKMKEVLRVLERISPSTMTVLLQGETGTGKQLLAQAIHHHGPRREYPFVTIDCAALSAQLLESELFGHRKGAFTGATGDRKGLFEEAHGGTVFLDEIDKTNSELQRRLLHVVDEGEVRPVGAQEYRQVDARIICATSHPDLRRAVDEGIFLKDLFYRLNDISVSLPPLRERKEDLGMLVEHFLQKASEELGKKEPRGLSRAALQCVMDYNWPGNVRELEKVIRRAVVLTEEGEEIRPEDLPPEPRGESTTDSGAEGAAAAGEPEGMTLARRVEDLERREVLAALTRLNWNKSQTARHLGLTRKGLRMKIERYGLDRRSQEGAQDS